jgi:alpha-ketoglutarate-dependent taurine dioxygenase
MSQTPGSKKLGALNRKRVSLSPQSLLRTGYLETGGHLPLVFQPAVKELNAVVWASRNRELIETELMQHGAILFRGFNVRTVGEFEQFIKAISGELLQYSYGSTPRSQISGNVYTSTEYPADQLIPLHNEMSYSRQWPMKIWFFCMQAATQGGATPIADSSRVFERISRDVRERFRKKMVMYVRNYGDGIDLPWQTVFGTTSRAAVEAFCCEAGIEFEWKKDGDRLRTKQTCQAVALHPKTGKQVWFNQAHLFHVSNLGTEIRASLQEEFAEADLPRNAYYGDGSPIESAVLDEIREAYRQEKVSFEWEERDILMLDNMSVAHGREPYAGSRKVVVGMAEPAGETK